MRFFNSRGKQLAQKAKAKEYKDKKYADEHKEEIDLINKAKQAAIQSKLSEIASPEEQTEIPKRVNKKYQKGEHKGERVISDIEFGMYVQSWIRDGEQKKINFLVKIEEIYRNRNQLHSLSNLEKLERIRNKFGR